MRCFKSRRFGNTAGLSKSNGDDLIVYYRLPEVPVEYAGEGQNDTGMNDIPSIPALPGFHPLLLRGCAEYQTFDLFSIRSLSRQADPGDDQHTKDQHAPGKEQPVRGVEQVIEPVVHAMLCGPDRYIIALAGLETVINLRP